MYLYFNSLLFFQWWFCIHIELLSATSVQVSIVILVPLQAATNWIISLEQILPPCEINLHSNAPYGQGQHMDIQMTDMILSISPATIRTLTAISSGLAPPQVKATIIFHSQIISSWLICTCLVPGLCKSCGVELESLQCSNISCHRPTLNNYVKQPGFDWVCWTK